MLLIQLPHITFSESGATINIALPIKTSRKGCPQPSLFLPFFRDKPELCVATLLQLYIRRTAAHRPPEIDRLFLTLQRPFKSASSQTLSRWIKATLKDSGINTKVFRAHSVRHAATSHAKRQGVSIDTIRATAGWSQQSAVFAQFYDRPLSSEGVFAAAVLG